MKKPRIFLGNAPWYRKGYYGVRAGSRWPHLRKEEEKYVPFPFFLAYTAALLEKHGFEISLLDAVALRLSNEKFLEKVIDFSPHIVILETSIPSFDVDYSIAREIKSKAKPELLIFCGAHHHLKNKDFLQNQDIVNMTIDGEYEKTVLQIVQAFEKDRNYEHIPGILFRGKEEVIKTKPRPLDQDIDSLPFPARHLLPMEKYYDGFCEIPYPSLQMWASRGCPYQCSFCSWPQLMYGSHRYRPRDPQLVLDEIEQCLDTGIYRSVYFDDDTFNIGHERIKEIARGFIERNFNVPWGFMARADLLNEQLLAFLKKSGLYAVKYGIESYNQQIVDQCGKALDLKKVRDVCLFTKKLGIKMHLTFTFGLPGETRETAAETLNFALEMDPDSVQFSIVTPFPGSRFFEEMQQKGHLVSANWNDYDGFSTSVIKTNHLEAKELEQIHREACQAWEKHCSRRKRRQRAQKILYSLRHPAWGYKKLREHLSGK